MPKRNLPQQKTARFLGTVERYELVLRAWEAISVERELRGVLAAVAEVICPMVSVSGIAAISFGSHGHAPYALHIVGSGSENCPKESCGNEHARKEAASIPARSVLPFDSAEAAERRRLLAAGHPQGCADLLAKTAWFEYEQRLVTVGIRSYIACPLHVGGDFIGLATFARKEPEPFCGKEIEILMAICRPLGVAVANAVANDEIQSLRLQLEEEIVLLRGQLEQAAPFREIIGDSFALRRVLESIEQVASTDATVLITGETGTGKELVARALHERSARARGPLVKLNCGAVPETLLASEFFGHERGAFTGAVGRRKGRLEQAHGGTLFLDEIGELPLAMQAMLLRALQEREFERLGSGDSVKVDVRIIAATNRNLLKEVEVGRFRSDLFYRLNVFPIQLPPLRERPEDISTLVAHFIQKHGARHGRKVNRIEPASMKMLQSYHWPGNIRELENVIERAMILSRSSRLRVDPVLLPASVLPQPLELQVDAREREAIEAALRASRGRVSGPHGAAKRLALPASTLEFRIQKLGIDKFRFR